jgi:hypothetical protein
MGSLPPWKTLEEATILGIGFIQCAQNKKEKCLKFVYKFQAFFCRGRKIKKGGGRPMAVPEVVFGNSEGMGWRENL